MPNVRYIVDDVDAAIAFYERLGFRMTERPGPPIAMMERDGLTLWVSGPGASATRTLADGSQPRPGGWNRFVIEVTDLDQRIAELEAAGVHFRSPIVSGPGGRQVVADDPSGNPIELFEPRS